MKKSMQINKVICQLLAMTVAVTPVAASAAVCGDDVVQAAQRGFNGATGPLQNVEDTVATKVQTATSCVETFNTVAGRVVMTPGGYDLTVARKVLANGTCRIVDGYTRRVTDQALYKLYSGVSSVQDQIFNNVPSVIKNTGVVQSTVGTAVTGAIGSGVPAAEQSIWGKISCTFGKC